MTYIILRDFWCHVFLNVLAPVEDKLDDVKDWFAALGNLDAEADFTRNIAWEIMEKEHHNFNQRGYMVITN
jgi:hypothetical protein